MATLEDVRADILFAIDEDAANWATPTETDRMINRAYREAWDIIIQKHEDYAVDPPKDFTIAAGASSHTLIADTPASNQIARTVFYKLRMLMRRGSDGQYGALESFTLEQSGALDGIGYMFMGDTIYVEPTEDAPGDYRAWYIPQTVALGDGATLKDPVNGGVEQYVIDVVSMRLTSKDEADASAYQTFAQKLEERIARMASHRNSGRPRKISDVRGSPFRFNTRRSFR